MCIPYIRYSFRGAVFAVCAVGLFAHSELSHTQRTRSLSLPLPPSSLSHHKATFPSGPRVVPASSPCFLSSFPCRLRPASHVPLRSKSASFLRPLGPQADSPGRLTELTVSTAGWLALPVVATQPATFLFSRVCATSRPGFTWRYLPACSLSSLTSLRATGSEFSRHPRALALDFTLKPFLS